MRRRPVALGRARSHPSARQLVGPIRLTDILDLVVGGLAGRGRRVGIYGALLLAVYDPEADRFQTICTCGTGFSDAELAGLPARLASLVREQRPARVDSRWAANVWFEPTLWSRYWPPS